MSQNDYVHCANCEHFRLTADYPYCIFEDMCNIYDPEDSKPLYERPFYKLNENVAFIMDMINRFQAHGRLYRRMKGADYEKSK